MKNGVKLIDKSQNSFIFFQLGIIAILMTVWVVLEMNFKTNAITKTEKSNIEINDDDVFVYNPIKEIKTEKQIDNTKKTVVKNVVKPSLDFKITKKEVEQEVKNDPNTTEEKNAKENKDNNENQNSNENNTNKEEIKDTFSVEYLPRFAACKNVPKDKQLACFEEQLQKEVIKNLVYPSVDRENNKEGIVYLHFIIDENGFFSQIFSIDDKRSTKDMKVAAEKAMKKLPKIIPAKIGEKPVKIKYSVPIKFSLAK